MPIAFSAPEPSSGYTQADSPRDPKQRQQAAGGDSGARGGEGGLSPQPIRREPGQAAAGASSRGAGHSLRAPAPSSPSCPSPLLSLPASSLLAALSPPPLLEPPRTRARCGLAMTHHQQQQALHGMPGLPHFPLHHPLQAPPPLAHHLSAVLRGPDCPSEGARLPHSPPTARGRSPTTGDQRRHHLPPPAGRSTTTPSKVPACVCAPLSPAQVSHGRHPHDAKLYTAWQLALTPPLPAPHTQGPHCLSLLSTSCHLPACSGRMYTALP